MVTLPVLKPRKAAEGATTRAALMSLGGMIDKLPGAGTSAPGAGEVRTAERLAAGVTEEELVRRGALGAGRLGEAEDSEWEGVAARAELSGCGEAGGPGLG